MERKNNKKGFTLAELLIVVAIIAVLVAIAIPVFTAQLEKSRESTDAANIRSAYAEITVKGIDEATSTSTKISVNLKQTQPKWQNSGVKQGLLDAFGSSNVTGIDSVKKSGKAVVTWAPGTSSKEGHAQVTIS